MTDYFALLGLPRRPWLDVSTIKDAYLRLSKEVHPDKTAEEGAAAELNAAYQCLRAPRTRILHLIELETGQQPGAIQAVPPELTEFFMRMTRLMRETDAFLRQWSAATGMVKAQMFEGAQQWVERLQEVQGDINSRVAEGERELATLDETWGRAAAGTLPRLVLIYHVLSYYGRWSSQVQERLTRIAL